MVLVMMVLSEEQEEQLWRMREGEWMHREQWGGGGVA